MQPRGMGSFCLHQPGPSWCCTSCHRHPCHEAVNSGRGQRARRGWSQEAALAMVSTSPPAWEQQRLESRERGGTRAIHGQPLKVCHSQ